jgi:hypothetical protein
MEEGLFPRPAVAAALRKVIEARLHYDSYDPIKRKAIKDYQRDVAKDYATPIYLIVDPKTNTILRKHSSRASEEEFIEFLLGTR